MKIIKLSINGQLLDCADCTSWRLEGTTPTCTLGISPMNCAECAQGTPRSTPSKKVGPPGNSSGPSLLAKAASWVRAEVSAVVSELPQPEIDARIAACMTCEEREAPEEGKLGFCKKCGCGKSPFAELGRKTKMPEATCPLGRWPS